MFPSFSPDMLGRKGCYAGVGSPAAGGDRSRVAERLQAALAGLQELHLLRDKQRNMVTWALRADREEPVTSVRPEPEAPGTMGDEEQRLEATLTTLKQQLSRLRRQDMGLKTHLQQLDEQIGELKLDMNKTSTEQLESDSRPSSGFYDLSDGGSCSLSNSCTSVYSECTSSSQTSLLPHTSLAHAHVASQADVRRRHSAEETATQPTPPRATGLHLGSSRIRASAAGTEQARPRPVSTGDLDKCMSQGLGRYKPADGRKASLSTNLKISTVDPKFQSSLVSRSGNEVYHYPSPLHAVALQSPIFSHGGELASLRLLEGPEIPANGSDALQMVQTQSYIDKLIIRNFSKTQSSIDSEAMQTRSHFYNKPSEVGSVCNEVTRKQMSVVQPPPDQTTSAISVDSEQKRHSLTHSGRDQADSASCKQSARAPYPAPVRGCSSDEVSTSSLKRSDISQRECASIEKSNLENRCRDNPEPRRQERNSQKQRSVTPHNICMEESRGVEVRASPQFVHAKFVPAGSERVKVRQADRKTKAVKLRRKNSESPRDVRQQHGYSSGERSCSGVKGGQRGLGKVKVTQICTTSRTEECRQGSGSDSSRSSPGLLYSNAVYPKLLPNPSIINPSRSWRHQGLEHTVDPRKRSQGGAKWIPNVEMYQAACAEHQRSKNPQTQTSRSMHKVRSGSSRTSPWTGPPRPSPSSMPSSSFLYSLDTKYPPAPYHASSSYPPRCESEYSAECASLFHSTIAESSEEEMSDNTTNRFGDSESSQSFQSNSGSDSSLSPDEDSQGEDRDLVWAEAAAGSPLRQIPRPEPLACRIKASRALKKKIRRFQPASLKVMTLV